MYLINIQYHIALVDNGFIGVTISNDTLSCSQYLHTHLYVHIQSLSDDSEMIPTLCGVTWWWFLSSDPVPSIIQHPGSQPSLKQRSHLLVKVTSLDQGHIYWSRSYLLIKFLSMIINQVHIYLSRSHLSINVTYTIKVTSIYPKLHLFIMVTSLFLCLMICYKSHTFLLKSHSNLFLSHLSVCV